MSKSTSFEPLVPDHRILKTFTFKAIILGMVLSMVLAAANAYIGLLVGMTVSASIPAAAAAMGIFRMFRRSNILECNLVQTSASAGESLVAGVIFTIPALVMMGAWQGYEYLPIVAISLIGGLLGVAYTIPLRKALIVDSDLVFPEGVATAQVLKTGGVETAPEIESDSKEDTGFKWLIISCAIGGSYKLLESGFRWISAELEVIKSVVGGKLLMMGGITMSPALVAIGFIVGSNIGSMIFIGGMLGTFIGVPLNWALNSERLLLEVGLNTDIAWADIPVESWEALAAASWQECRRVGVGAMLVGGFWSLLILIKPVWKGIVGSLDAYRKERKSGEKLPRTQRDTPFPIVWGFIALSIIPTYFVFLWALQDYEYRFWVSAFMTALIMGFGFIFSAVAGYIAGLVGSSNSPISGVTIATVVVSAVILLKVMGNEGPLAILGPMAVMYLAGFICSAASIAGDNTQDLQCGYLLGATPWKQQVFQVIGVVSSALVIPFTLSILDQGHGIGRAVREGTPFLTAPQASLMKDISTGIFGAGINWNYIALGALLAVVIIVIDQIQRIRGNSFRFPVLAVAVGIYLPMGLSVPIFMGGLLMAWVQNGAKKKNEEKRTKVENRGLLLASGIITGEALMGVGIAVFAVLLPQFLPGEIALAPHLGAIALLSVMIYLVRYTKKASKD
jgi:putative OPT family oligopeptide transporter